MRLALIAYKEPIHLEGGLNTRLCRTMHFVNDIPPLEQREQ